MVLQLSFAILYLLEGRAYTQFTDPHGFGVALLTYSAILSRGLKRVKVRTKSGRVLRLSMALSGRMCGGNNGVFKLNWKLDLLVHLVFMQMDACQLGMSQPFIGEHCYAAQELVNLLVAGPLVVVFLILVVQVL